MRLSRLLEGLPVTAPAAGGADPEVADPEATNPEIRGVAHDSRRAEPGDLFVAWAGARHDGRRFAADASARGAVAVLADGPSPEGAQLGLPWALAAAPRSLLGPLASRAYDHPDRELLLAGVTGTNGKSTVVALLGGMLERAGHATGLIGTLGYRFRGRDFNGERTTPEASDFFRTLRRMKDAGATAVAMEVSSHALDQGRVAGAEFALAVFTNLTRDHFDYHRDFEDYFAAKRRLFAQLADAGAGGPGGKAVLNVEDPYGRRLAEELAPRRGSSGQGTVTYGVGGEVSFSHVELSSSGSRGVISTPRGPLPFTTRLLGRYNLANVLAAAAAGEALGLPHDAVAQAIAGQLPLPGRMEPVERGQPFPVYIDYAHTPEALAAAASSAREMTRRRLVLVFGCGGDRDPGKRPLMGRAAGENADLVILTSDNPRSEDPLAIIAAAEQGLQASGNAHYLVIPDRREAIHRAIAGSDEGSAVLVAGKGHEQVQILGERMVPFSDLEEITHALEEKLGQAAHR